MAKLNIVLFQPSIPQNTGNIMRTAKATNSVIHLIKPIGFTLDTKLLKRTSIKYVENVDMKVYENYEDFMKQNNSPQLYFITRYGYKPHSEANFKIDKDIYIAFGSEATGIDKKILQDNKDMCFRLPMTVDVRSVNLSNCVMTVVYECLRQNDYFDLLKEEPHKKNYL